MKKMTRVALITSGGDCQGLNAAIRGVGKALLEKLENIEIFGMYDGYRGLIESDYKFMTSKDFSGILTEGGTILGTSRQHYIPGKDIVDEKGNSLIPAMKDTYNRLNLDCLVIMGGNGTQKSAKLISDAGMNVVTLPKTIDNDIYGTDTTFGFQSAVDIATNVIDYIHSTASSHSRIFVVELMGRDAGWLTLNAGIASGADVITTGNHVYRRPEFYQELERNPDILRPANYPDTAPGSGFCLVDLGRVQAAVLNLMGVIYMEPLRNPFDTADDLVRQAVDAGARIILLDFHAEATSEKRAMGYYLDGRITAMFGTHTHVQTADACVLPKGTGYITDVGMTGPQQSVLGVQPEIAIAKMKDLLPVRFENAGGRAVVCGCVFDVDEKSGLTRQAQPICQLVEVEDQKGDHK